MPMVTSQAWRCTTPASREKTPSGGATSPSRLKITRSPGTRPGRPGRTSRAPGRPMSAGTKPTATTSATATTLTPAAPSARRISAWKNISPDRLMATMRPENSTVRPATATVRPTACSTSSRVGVWSAMTLRSSSRNRLTMSRP